MIFRRILLGLGAVALLTGIALSVVWLKAPASTAAAEKAVPPQFVLTAARTLREGTLLRADDIRWTQMAPAAIPPASYIRGQATDTEVLGAATRREFHPGDALVADQLIKPSEPGFLPAVLAPGMRATSIAVDVAEGGAGLIAPGDRVDVILTQTFTDTGLSVSQRSVGETILPNLRVIAIDQAMNAPRPGEAHLPKTVTLEVSVHQAEVLMVAGQLGKLQLTLRSLADANQPASSTPLDPTWAWEVSPALRLLSHGTTGPVSSGPISASPPGRAQTSTAPTEIQIIRGSKGERVCYSVTAGASVDCTGASATTAPVPPAAKSPEPHAEAPRS